MKDIKIGLIGLGTVGCCLLEILRNDHARLVSRSGINFSIVKICDRSYQKKGKILQNIPATDHWQELIDDPTIEIIVELIGGVEPAHKIIDAALRAGKAVVTANKALLAKHGNQILKLARETEGEIAFEAAVAGALPVIKNLRRALVADQIDVLYGILNGTCNFIITRMQEDNMDYSAALQLAQDKGFAEADPAFDVEGLDAAQKLAILSALSFDTAITESAVNVTGITALRKIDHDYARQMNHVIRLLAVARRDPLQMHVQPVMIPRDHILASVREERNAIYFESNHAGPSLIMGQGAGGGPTAASVLSDLLFLASKDRSKSEHWLSGTLVPQPYLDLQASFYLRFQTTDRPGVLARIAHLLAEEEISIAQLHQQEGQEPVDVVLITHTISEKKLKNALRAIDSQDFILAPTVILRFEKKM